MWILRWLWIFLLHSPGFIGAVDDRKSFWLHNYFHRFYCVFLSVVFFLSFQFLVEDYRWVWIIGNCLGLTALPASFKVTWWDEKFCYLDLSLFWEISCVGYPFTSVVVFDRLNYEFYVHTKGESRLAYSIGLESLLSWDSFIYMNLIRLVSKLSSNEGQTIDSALQPSLFHGQFMPWII